MQPFIIEGFCTHELVSIQLFKWHVQEAGDRALDTNKEAYNELEIYVFRADEVAWASNLWGLILLLFYLIAFFAPGEAVFVTKSVILFVEGTKLFIYHLNHLSCWFFGFNVVWVGIALGNVNFADRDFINLFFGADGDFVNLFFGICMFKCRNLCRKILFWKISKVSFLLLPWKISNVGFLLLLWKISKVWSLLLLPWKISKVFFPCFRYFRNSIVYYFRFFSQLIQRILKFIFLPFFKRLRTRFYYFQCSQGFEASKVNTLVYTVARSFRNNLRFIILK